MYTNFFERRTMYTHKNQTNTDSKPLHVHHNNIEQKGPSYLKKKNKKSIQHKHNKTHKVEKLAHQLVKKEHNIVENLINTIGILQLKFVKTI